jgi:hypothetical protein
MQFNFGYFQAIAFHTLRSPTYAEVIGRHRHAPLRL